MTMWEATPEGYLECFAGSWYGVVGLTPPGTGWAAYLQGPRGRNISPILYHTASEAKAWVEARLQEQCA